MLHGWTGHDWAIEGSDTFHQQWGQLHAFGLKQNGVSLNAIDRPDNQRAKKKAVKLSVQSVFAFMTDIKKHNKIHYMMLGTL